MGPCLTQLFDTLEQHRDRVGVTAKIQREASLHQGRPGEGRLLADQAVVEPLDAVDG